MLPTFSLQCPIPISDYPTITLAHGGGGRLSQMLVERMFVPAFANAALEALHDGAVLDLGLSTLAPALRSGASAGVAD